tara:strand:+ start:2339 stop:3601 length:1263 start_codon:yes stop_codon:yes gene_type:complete
MTEIISWKGKTFDQISSVIQKNKGNNMVGIFKANPLKIYRRELKTNSCNERISMSLDKINMPGGLITRGVSDNSVKNNNGLTSVLDINLTENKYERPGTGNCSNDNICFNQADNARRRVRSSGMIPKKFNENKNNDRYYTSSSQYLASRSKRFEQNQYYNIKSGDATVQAGVNSAMFNTYSTNTLSHCPKVALLTNTSFKYTWIDDTEVTISVPAGNYSISDINGLLSKKLISNHHYYLNNENSTKELLLSMNYILDTNKTQLNIKAGGTDNFSEDKYSIPLNVLSGTEYWTKVNGTKTPKLTFDDENLRNMLGLTVNEFSTVGSFVSVNETLLKPSYVPVYYKPSNSKFANQGAVDSSSRTVRLKYDSITNSTKNYRDAYGSEVANALAYGVSSYGYTIKDKIGYPNKCTPKFPKKCYK